MESLITLQPTERGMRKPGTEVPGRRKKLTSPVGTPPVLSHAFSMKPPRRAAHWEHYDA